MNFDRELILFILILSALLSIFITILLYKRRKAPGAKYFTYASISSFIWTVGYLVEFIGNSLETKLFGVDIQYFFGIPFISTFWMAAALNYYSSGQKPTRITFIGINIVPLITMILMWTNGLHHLMYKYVSLIKSDMFLLLTKEIGLWYIINVVYSYGMLLAGSIILIYSLKKSKSIYRGQITIFVIASVFPWIGNILYLIGMNSFMRIDLTPIAFSITLLLIWLGLFRYHLFDIVPAARNHVIESMPNGVMVLDDFDRIIDVNNAANSIFNSDELIGKTKD